ncbi:MAG: 30S ribosome-binding factor RbfA [Thiobacillaceae bacterium]|jgi:ribosome-binding factor A|nr:MAG: ribosome-binding factor A [bacterium]KAF0147870.1 MAG: ribosome-binding factor A [bacterium]KAF0167471.1 MAG: ribosome-binding factor A [bacterium]MCU0933163.1 30S ribosome-binding factor RbfA [Thiobacillaceae bacterium]TXT20993.1 MAG: ribosome-binding factor A [bacterium]
MAHTNPRSRRVAEQIRHELADIVLREMKDPRVAGVSFTAVDVSSDLEHAKVWFTTFQADHEAARQGLAHAAGFLRTELAHRMRMRTVPKLGFQYDESVERGAHLSHLIDLAVEEDRRHHQDQPPRDDEAQG